MKAQLLAVVFIAVFFCLLEISSYAVVPSTIHYQGRLLDSFGDPVEGITDVTFAIYDTPTGGTPLWSEVHEDLDVHRGFVIVSLGSESPVYRTLIEKTLLPYYLGIKVNNDPEIVPRQEIESVPYALLSSGVAGDIHTDSAKLMIDGQPGFPPQLTIKDHSSVTPTIDEQLLLNDLSVALIVDRGAGDVDRTEMKADGLKIYYPSGAEAISFAPGAVLFQGTPVDFNGTEAQFLGSAYQSDLSIDPDGIRLKSQDAAPLPSLPPTGEPYFVVSDDIINQLFYSMVQSGSLRTACVPAGTLAELLPTELKFSTDGGVTSATKLSNTGLELQGGSVQLLDDCALTVTGVTLCDDEFSVDVDDDATIDYKIDLGTAGPEVFIPIQTELRCDGNAFFTRGVEHDVDNDGTPDFVFSSDVTSPYLQVESACHLRCDGTASFSDMSSSGTVSISGSMSCTGDWSCDPDNDASIDLSCSDTPSGPKLLIASGLELACAGESQFSNRVQFDVNNNGIVDVAVYSIPSPELSVSTGTRFSCDGLATFAQPVQVNSSLTVNGALLVTGPKAFVQDHPEDAAKEIVYVALEGNEAGTYTRGSAQLKNGVANIELPKDFHLVTNDDGLTVQITPRGPVSSMLYVESVTPTTLLVKASNKNDAGVKFDFMVNGVRKGFENHQVIRDKKSLAMNE